MLAADIVFVAAFVMMAGCNLYFGPNVSERVAMQWSLTGQPVWFLAKRAAMWGPIAFAMAVRLLIYLAMTYTPDRVHGAELGICIFSIIVAAAHAGTIYAATRKV